MKVQITFYQQNKLKASKISKICKLPVFITSLQQYGATLCGHICTAYSVLHYLNNVNFTVHLHSQCCPALNLL